MKTKFLVLSATILGGLLSSATFADTTVLAAPTRALLELPEPVQVVNPTRLPIKYEGATVDVVLTVDADGKAHDVRVPSSDDRNLRDSLVSAVKQWQFKPATKNGMPVSSKVILPVQLI